MASINEMLDDITAEIFRTAPFDQRTEVIVDPSLNYGLDLYQVVTGDETFDGREIIQSDGLQFVEQIENIHVNGDNGEVEDENIISTEMKTFNQFFNEAVKDIKKNSQKPPVEVEERSQRTKSQFTLRRIEADFSKSDKKIKLLDALKSIGNEKGWYKKIDNFTAKLMNENITSNRDIPFQDYVEKVSDYCLKTMPRLMADKIKSEVSEFVKQYSKPFDEIYAEALAEVETVTSDEIKKMREMLVKTAPLKPEIVYIGGPAISYEVSVQTDPALMESASQTIEGLGTFDDKDFESIINNDNLDVQMANQPSSEYYSETEAGAMSKETSEVVKTKLETEIEKQKRIREDMRQALNPKLGLQLSQIYPDHREMIKRLKDLTEFDLKVFEESFAEQIDKTLPPPEVLTLKWNDKIYKYVTTWTWISPTCDEMLPPEKRRKRAQKHEKAFLYIPPASPNSLKRRSPNDSSQLEFPPFIKRRFGILEENPLTAIIGKPPPKKRRPKRINFLKMPFGAGIKKDENGIICMSDSESESNESDTEINDSYDHDKRQIELNPDSESSDSFSDSDSDDQSSVDSLEFLLLKGRNKRRKIEENQTNSEIEISKESESTEMNAEVETTEVQEEENVENNFDEIESCDEDELWDDFIPERVFAEKCPYANTYIEDIDSF
uniref:Uncharacterized protein n=1 Tax=Panagrolaimus sp. PS1159 TaxID=55785 RepID=A0AC35GA86_9BILA